LHEEYPDLCRVLMESTPKLERKLRMSATEYCSGEAG
jgi:hypothetical protein